MSFLFSSTISSGYILFFSIDLDFELSLTIGCSGGNSVAFSKSLNSPFKFYYKNSIFFIHSSLIASELVLNLYILSSFV